MAKKARWLIKKLLFLCILIGIGLFGYESIHFSGSREDTIGITTNSVRTEYTYDTYTSHLGYLETFTFEGEKIRYLDRGDRDGIPLLLVHGTPTNSRLRRKMIPPLVSSGYRVIAPDQFGFGVSDKGTTHEELSTKRQSKRLIALMGHLDIQDFAIAGHDQGSLRVWETITNIPNRISHLIILNSIGDRAGFHPPAGFGSENLSTKFSGRAMGSKAFGRIFAYGAMLGGLKDVSHATPSMIDGYLWSLLHDMNITYFDFITHFDEVKEDLSTWQSRFAELNIPTTIIWGAHDKILVGEEQIPVLEELFNVQEKEIHLLEQAAHFIQEEAAEEVSSLIARFVK